MKRAFNVLVVVVLLGLNVGWMLPTREAKEVNETTRPISTKGGSLKTK